jgi:O-antigen/teichoic acid export membrane protein
VRWREAAWVSGGIGSSTLSTLAAHVLVVRALPDPEAGQYFLAFSAVTAGGLILRLGLDQGLLRAAAERNTECQGGVSMGLVANALGIVGAFGAALGCIVLFAAWASWPGLDLIGDYRFVFLTVCWLVADSLRLVVAETLRGLRRVGFATVYGNGGRSALSLVMISITTLHGELTPVTAVVAHLSANSLLLLSALVTAMGQRKRRADGRASGLAPRGKALSAQKLLTISLPFYIGALTTLAANGGDVIVASAVLEHGDIAQYAAVSKLAQAVNIPLVASTLLLAPTLPILLKRKDELSVERALRDVSTIIALPVTALAAFLFLFSDEVVSRLFPNSLDEAAVTLMLLLLGPLVSAVTGPNGFALMVAGEGKTVFAVASLASSVHLAGVLVLGHFLGVRGVAASSVVGACVLNTGYAIALHRRLGIVSFPYLHPSAVMRAFRVLGPREN